MSPLVLSPNRGYADYQRIDNYDEGLVWNENPGPINFAVNSPVLDVSRYSRLGGFMQVGLQGMLVELSWYADSAGTVGLGSKQFMLTNLINDAMQPLMINMGPFCKVSLQGAAAGNYQPIIKLYGTNRDHPLEFVPMQAVLIDEQLLGIGANGTQTIYPSDYYAGPLNVWYQPAFASGAVAFEYLTIANAWDLFDHTTQTVASADYRYTTITPTGAWRVIVGNNTAAASDFYLAATPTLTGSG
jgi:hypothetical protein